jgi:hypothetical protein
MDKKAVKDVSLKTVAQTPHSYPEPSAPWNLKAPCHKDRAWQQRIPASFQNPCLAIRNDNEWFKELGLVSVRDIWIKVQGYDNTASAPS